MLGTGAPELRVRALNGEAMARAQNGDVKSGLSLLAEARALVETRRLLRHRPRRGASTASVSAATCSRASRPQSGSSTRRSRSPSAPGCRPTSCALNIFAWRSRCYRRQRDYEAAREDVERALELAESLQDARALGAAYFQASLLAERDGHYVLARTYAEQAKSQYEELADRANVGRLMNNLGAIEFLLGKPEQSRSSTSSTAFSVALELGRDEEAAKAVSSLAQVHLRTGNVEKAEEQALQALEIIGEREDMLDEIGNARLVLGRALLEQGRLDEAEVALAEAEDAFARLSSASHRAAAWVAQGDLATKRGDERRAAVLYRRAAEALQDFRF